MATILVIEDNEIALRLCSIMLGEKHHVLEARNSDEGLKLLSEIKPDLVITDLMVPDSNGFFPHRTTAVELVGALRQIDKKVKIVVYSVLCYEPRLQKQALALGADACLIKMGDAELFRKTINRFLGLETLFAYG